MTSYVRLFGTVNAYEKKLLTTQATLVASKSAEIKNALRAKEFMKLSVIQLSLMLTALSALGQGTFQYDQQVNNTNPPGGYLNIQPDPSGQSFVPSLSTVGFVQLSLKDSIFFNGIGATMHVNLWSDSLTNGIFLGSTAPVFIPDVFVGAANFLFSTPIPVSPGVTYYFQPVIESGDSAQIGVVGLGYANGTAFFNGVAAPSTDLWFREGVVVPEPSSAVIALIGIARFSLRR